MSFHYGKHETTAQIRLKLFKSDKLGWICKKGHEGLGEIAVNSFLRISNLWQI